MEGKLIVGLDMGTTKICAIVGEPIDDKIDIKGVGVSSSYGLKKGMVVDMKKATTSIKRAVKKAEYMSKASIDSVYIGVAGAHVSSFNSRGAISISRRDHIITERDEERVIDAACQMGIPPNREIIHVIPQEFILDGQEGVKEPVGMAALRLEVEAHIVTGAVTSLQNVVQCAYLAGLDVEDIVLQPLASSEAVLTEEEKEIGTILVDIGGGTTDVAIFMDGGIWYSHVLPVGGSQVTRDLTVGLRVLPSEAEDLKKKYGCALSKLVDELDVIEVNVIGSKPKPVLRKQMTDIIEARMREIFSLVRKEVMQTGWADILPGGVVLTGGSSLLKGLPELVSEMFDLPARVGYPKAVIVGRVEEVQSPIFATGVGLLLYASKNRGTEEIISAKGTILIDRIIDRVKNWFKNIF